MASTPPSVQASNNSDADGITAAIPPVVRKIPEPMTLPTTKRIADQRPMARTSFASCPPVATATLDVPTKRPFLMQALVLLAESEL
jgi:hypothetical protein